MNARPSMRHTIIGLMLVWAVRASVPLMLGACFGATADAASARSPVLPAPQVVAKYVYDAPPTAAIPIANARTAALRGYDVADNVSGIRTRAAGRRRAAKEAPTVVFSGSRAPGLAQNFDDAVANGAPTRLTRVDAAARDANRRAALRGQPPARAGQSLDEYQFACSAQSGWRCVRACGACGEQSYQGGVLSRFFQQHGVRPGDPFDVMFGP